MGMIVLIEKTVCPLFIDIKRTFLEGLPYHDGRHTGMAHPAIRLTSINRSLLNLSRKGELTYESD